MTQFSTSAYQNTHRAIPRKALWGCGGVLAGLLLGALLMLLGLIAFAPHPLAASPGARDQTSDLSITMDDAYLTQVIAAAVSQASLPISLSNIQTEIQPGNQVKISAKTSSTFPVGLQMTAVAQLSAQSGHLAMHIASAQVGGLSLPASAVSALEQQINNKLTRESSFLLPSNYVITAINTTEHHLQMSIAQK